MSENQRQRAVTLVAHAVRDMGGQELAMAQLAKGLLARGHRVVVIARECTLEPHPGLSWIRVCSPARPFPLAYVSFFVFAGWSTRRNRRGVLHTLGAILPNRADLATVQFCHLAFQSRKDDGEPPVGGGVLRRLNAAISRRLSRRIEAWCYRRRITRLVPVSSGVAGELRHWYPRATVTDVISNAVDAERFQPDLKRRRAVHRELGIADGGYVVCFVGGDWKRKGLRFAIEALVGAEVWRLLVVGPGDIRRFGHYAKSLGVDDRVNFIGPQRDTARFYAAADAFVLPTAYETFSIATYEAAASGLPLLVTKVNGVEDILHDDDNGWFINRDGPEIARRLLQLERNPTTRKQMGRRARAAASRWDWAEVIDRYAALYASLPRTADGGQLGSTESG